MVNKLFKLEYFKGQHCLLLAFLLLHTLVAAIHVSYQGITTDERAYYVYGIRWLHGQVERVEKQDDSKSPFVVLSAIPRTVIQLLHPNYQATDDGLADMLMGRYCMVAYTWIIAIYFFAWCRKLFGERSWIIPLLFFLFDPMVIAYSMLIGTDMATGACVIAVFYHLYRFQILNSNRHFAFFCLWLGMACVVKPSLIFLLPCLVCLYLILWLGQQVQLRIIGFIKYSMVAILSVLFVINAMYFFRNSFTPLGDLHTQSIAFTKLQLNVPFIKKIPVPVPQTYYASVDLLQYHKEIGGGTPKSSYPGVYLNGAYKMEGGFWYYYLVVAGYKLPLITLLLSMLTLIHGLIKFNPTAFFRKHIWYVWPLIFFLSVLSFLNSFQIGLRHILTIYPFCFIAMAGFVQNFRSRYAYATPAAWLAFVALLIPVGLSFPNLLAFTNPLVGDKKMVYQKMNDSNVDYSQALPFIQHYIDQHPGVELASPTPKAGTYIVPIQYLHKGNLEVGRRYQWYLNFLPIDQYKYSLLIYDISAEEVRKLKGGE